MPLFLLALFWFSALRRRVLLSILWGFRGSNPSGGGSGHFFSSLEILFLPFIINKQLTSPCRVYFVAICRLLLELLHYTHLPGARETEVPFNHRLKSVLNTLAYFMPGIQIYYLFCCCWFCIAHILLLFSQVVMATAEGTYYTARQGYWSDDVERK